MKNFSGITEDLDITTKKYVDDNKVTSIDGLAGGTLTSPFKVTGGDGANTAKIALDQSGNGQITDSGTSTIFGFMSASDLTVGSANYNTRFRGKQTRPTWNGNDLALKTDVPSATEIVQTIGTSASAVMSQKATTDELAKKANLDGGNDFRGNQTITNGKLSVSCDSSFDNSYIFDVFDDVHEGDSIFAVEKTGDDAGAIHIGDGIAKAPILLGNNAGTSGQVLTSQGAGKTPAWSDIVKHGYTELTNENLNTIVEVGWYRAAANNSCTNTPPLAGVNAFVLVTEKGKDTFVKQTVWLYHSSFVVFTDCYCRYTRDSGNSWGDWLTLQMVDHNPQAFYGRKTFSDGISLSGSLEVNNSSGTAGQVLTSTGTGAPVWADAGGSTDTMPTIRLVSIADIAGTCICSATNPLRFSFVVEKGTLLPTDMVQLCSRQLFTYKNGHMLRPGDPAVHGRTYKLRQFFSKEISAITLQQGHYIFEVNSYPELREFVRSNMNTGDRSTLIKYLRISRATQGEVPNHLFSNVIPIYVAPSAPSESAQTVKIRIR